MKRSANESEFNILGFDYIIFVLYMCFRHCLLQELNQIYLKILYLCLYMYFSNPSMSRM